MIWVLLLSTITILAVFYGLKKKKAFLFTIPVISIFIFILVKIIMVPVPFLDTVRFIFGLS
ncbi:hypothetical protein [Aquibacillus kalidii]|uniref:hypothetical protein n=1 Tax=Aquibacillus kalidii TaxID=2762597 RepID=UPI00164898B8|nr:hypothetical protein [Aquibacillus kalidii]